jgi:hypothetical protein
MNSLQVSINVREYSQTSPTEARKTQPTVNVIAATCLFDDALAFGARLHIYLSLHPLLECFVILHLVTCKFTMKMFVTLGAYTDGT